MSIVTRVVLNEVKKTKPGFFLFRFLRSFYFTGQFFVISGLLGTLCLLAYFFPGLYQIARLSALILPVIILVDLLLLYSRPKGIFARRDMMEKLSNGDLNDIDRKSVV